MEAGMARKPSGTEGVATLGVATDKDTEEKAGRGRSARNRTNGRAGQADAM